MQRANLLQLPITLIDFDPEATPTPHQPSTLKILSIPTATAVEAGKLNILNAHYVVKCLETAADLCLAKKAAAIVTGPIHKSILNDAGISFSGHTEFLAARCHAKEVLMLFVVNQIKAALMTTHLPLANVAATISQEIIITKIKLLHHELINKFSIKDPKILVCGLNPHAGENGHLGREEIDIIEPALNSLRKEKLNIIGPLPADTIFTAAHLNHCDAIIGMYHDQILPAIKYIGFDQAVNVTLGLPIIRTSVDHGTALTLAGSGQANPGSLEAAILLAISLSNVKINK
jgi:4-hydroxythreonine-4-phosphate dehydrogenase